MDPKFKALHILLTNVAVVVQFEFEVVPDGRIRGAQGEWGGGGGGVADPPTSRDLNQGLPISPSDGAYIIYATQGPKE